MRPTWILAVAVGLTLGPAFAGPAFAQTKIPPSRLYTNVPPIELDKDYGLPKQGGAPDPDVPQQKATTANPQDQPDAFRALSTYAMPDAEPADAPDFFRDPAGVGPDTQASDVPNFFQTVPDTGLPKAQRPRQAYSTLDTPQFTTDGSTTGDLPSDRSRLGEALPGDIAPSDATAPDAAGRP